MSYLSMRDMVRRGWDSARISEYLADTAKETKQQAGIAKQQAQYKSDPLKKKRENNNRCLVCDCLISWGAKRCVEHAGLARREHTVKMKMTNRKIRKKSNDLMDRGYFQGGLCSGK